MDEGIVLSHKVNRQFEQSGVPSDHCASVTILTMLFDRELVEAKLALNLIPSADMPKIAWDALEAGLDGPGIRRLAALEQPTAFEVGEVLPRASEEMGVSQLGAGEAALRVARRHAKEILESGDDPLRHTRDFENLWAQAGYPTEIASVGNLYDEVYVGEATGESENEIRSWVTARLKELIR
jgi:hypothetical protein